MVKGQKLLSSLKKKKASQKWCFFDSQIDHVIICIILCDRLKLFLTDLGNHNVGTEVWIWLSGFLSTVYLNNLIAWKVILKAALSSYLLGERHCCRFSSNWKSLILISVRGACENMIKYRGIRHSILAFLNGEFLHLGDSANPWMWELLVWYSNIRVWPCLCQKRNLKILQL